MKQARLPSLEVHDPNSLPDYSTEFINEEEIREFAKALNTPDTSAFVSLNDWKPIYQRVTRRSGPPRRGRKKKKPQPRKDETREGFVYTVFKWPLLLVVLGWILVLGFYYWITRLYVYAYEQYVTWRGRRQNLRRNIQSKVTYEEWKGAAEELDLHLGNEAWKVNDEYAYYDHGIVKEASQRLQTQLKNIASLPKDSTAYSESIGHLKDLVESCVKYNFVGVENPRLYSESYYGTKKLVQTFADQLQSALTYLLQAELLSKHAKYTLCTHLNTNYGRTALCLSGGASFAWYHFGIVKALLDASLLPDVVTGTSGGALVAALVATRTDDELRSLLVPALAYRMNACSESFPIWFPRWWKTGARFDPLQWAVKCSWFTRGSLTFREAYERTGRILNISCVPSDPHSPTALINYLTAPDCVVWSAVLASAAVPGILPAINLMAKASDGTIVPSSFGHKWKDGSLRTDIPLKALNLHFGVTFPIVSQVNPHINAFFYASKGTVGRPVTHRKGRGWRGGYLGSATETWIKLELEKFLKILRHLELLPRPLGQDWSSIWLQKFSGTITIWPKTRLSDFWYILSDPTPQRLARMMLAGQRSTWPKLLFIQNRMKIEKLIDEGLRLYNDDGMFIKANGSRPVRRVGPNARSKLGTPPADSKPHSTQDNGVHSRSSSVLEEIKRQSGVFFDDIGAEGEDTTGESEIEDVAGNESGVEVAD